MFCLRNRKYFLWLHFDVSYHRVLFVIKVYTKFAHIIRLVLFAGSTQCFDEGSNFEFSVYLTMLDFRSVRGVYLQVKLFFGHQYYFQLLSSAPGIDNRVKSGNMSFD